MSKENLHERVLMTTAIEDFSFRTFYCRGCIHTMARKCIEYSLTSFIVPLYVYSSDVKALYQKPIAGPDKPAILRQ